jgi:tetratricopeptide (TPR) repeat protein
VLLLLALTLLGCARNGEGTGGPETDDPLYRHGQQLLKQGRTQEALSAFLQLIEERGDRAPQSHLEAGLIYDAPPFDNPIYAIYHFRRFLELDPNSRQADLVRGRIDAAMRQFARSLPARPLENQTARFDAMAKIDQLERENQQLRARLARFDPGAVNAGNGSGLSSVTVPAPPPSTLSMRLPSIAGAAPNSGTTATPPVQRARPPGAAPTSASPPAGRIHVVAPGETLYGIAQRYYGSGAKWPEILKANRDILKNENEVRPGMQLRIP